ncbi:hypothetical protein E4L96_15495 [Massilia arenosa]|uniref:DUF805 domain-containing protein n=1 Tax=Zemynaea arenosa TaxID=2561931 RepID=A0A4Y9S5Y9_9BURK|nr:hypothetical protein E4L96_15495 [Massilia arenosa]
MSIWHWLIVLILFVAFVFPYAKIIRKAGYSGWWVLVMFVPLVNIIAIWAFALLDWPVTQRARAQSANF